MGATNFIDIKWTDDSLQGAYLHAVDEAYAEHGSAPYNGTISTTNGVTQVLAPHTMTGHGAALVSAWLNDGLVKGHPDSGAHKWEDAKAIAIASEDAFAYTTKTLTFTLDALREFIENSVEDFDGEWARNERLRAAVECPEQYMWEFVAAKVSETFPLNLVHAAEHTYAPKVKLVTRRSQVKPATRYEVVDARGAVVKSFPARPLATDYIKSTLGSDSPRHISLGVRTVKHYADIHGGAASITERTVVSAKISVKVTLATLKREEPKDAKHGWLFYGVASI